MVQCQVGLAEAQTNDKRIMVRGQKMSSFNMAIKFFKSFAW